MNIPENLRYTKTHEWILEEEGAVTVGLTDYAQDALGDLVFVNLPMPTRSRRGSPLRTWKA